MRSTIIGILLLVVIALPLGAQQRVVSVNRTRLTDQQAKAFKQH